MKSIAAVAVCALLGACGDDSSAGPIVDGGIDADTDVEPLPVFDCWPDIAPVERGTLTLGKGGVAYAEMPPTLSLEYGPQGGYMVKVWTKMTGFIPGGPPLISPKNPFTRVRATFADTGMSLQLPSECGARFWYVDDGAGAYDLWEEFAVVFDTCWHKDRLVGARIKLDAELMDATGSYAKDSRIITATELIGHDDPTPTEASCGT